MHPLLASELGPDFDLDRALAHGTLPGVSEIHRRLGTLWPEAALFHFRTRGGAEVDFVVELGRELWGIEVKASTSVTRRMLRGLASFASRSSRVRRRIVVFLGARKQAIDGVEVLPLADFLTLLPGEPG